MGEKVNKDVEQKKICIVTQALFCVCLRKGTKNLEKLGCLVMEFGFIGFLFQHIPPFRPNKSALARWFRYFRRSK